jgi:hypothetical protein
MFETKKTLIVVYKDELLMNQLKKLIETHDDDSDNMVGTKDDSINVVSWEEKVWLGNKKAGNIQGKILFLDEIKGTDKLIPVLDIKLDKYGIKFGWAGNQAVLFADPKALKNSKQYDEFRENLSSLPVPDFLKSEKNRIIDLPNLNDLLAVKKEEKQEKKQEKKKIKLPDMLKPVGDAISVGADAIEKVGDQIVVKSKELFRNKELVKRQMLFYGAVRLYNDYLEQFMNQ